MKADEASSPKGPWSYAPLGAEQARWFWTKSPFTRKGAAACHVGLAQLCESACTGSCTYLVTLREHFVTGTPSTYHHARARASKTLPV